MTRRRALRRRERLERRDDAALAQIRVQRTANRAWRMPRGARWRHVTTEGVQFNEHYEIYAMRRYPDGRPYVVFQCVENPNAFIFFDDRTGPPDPRGWC